VHAAGVNRPVCIDATKNLININGNKYMATDASDWEAATRKVTLTYAGLTPSGYLFGQKDFGYNRV